LATFQVLADDMAEDVKSMNVSADAFEWFKRV
jgi:hypothetical protein